MARRVPGLKSRKSGGVRGQASLGPALLRRPAVLATLMLDRIKPEHEPAASGDFRLWLRFVLTPEETARFRRWSRHDRAGCRALEKRFRQAVDDADLEVLLQQTRSALASAPGRSKSGAGRRARSAQ